MFPGIEAGPVVPHSISCFAPTKFEAGVVEPYDLRAPAMPRETFCPRRNSDPPSELVEKQESKEKGKIAEYRRDEPCGNFGSVLCRFL